jgi:amino-acid N-acetyltransferase
VYGARSSAFAAGFTVIIRPGVSEDFATVTSWLRAAELPAADIDEAHMSNFLVAVIDDAPAGIVGLEQYENTGLLRSLVVDPAARSGGIGRRLVAALEANAASRGVEELWLLTIDADAYFVSLGYEVVERADAPDVIRQTTEFSKLCPGDAVLMLKKL